MSTIQEAWDDDKIRWQLAEGKIKHIFYIGDVRELIRMYDKEEMSLSRFCEMLNVMACIAGASESPSKGMKWVKASERLNADDHEYVFLKGCRVDKGILRREDVYDNKMITLYYNGPTGTDELSAWAFGHPELENIFWLDESTESDPSNPVVDEPAKRLAEALLFVNKLLVRFDAEGRWNDCSDCERLIQLLTRPNT